MAVRTYLMLMLGVSIVMYFMGYTSPFVELMGQVGTESVSWNLVINGIFAIFTNPTFLATIGIASISSLLFLGGSSQSVLFIIPIIILIAFADFFVLPTSFLLQAGVPEAFKFIANTFLNMSLMLTIIEFVTGRA